MTQVLEQCEKTIKVFQNYIFDEDKQELDPNFIPNDWRHNPEPIYREIGIFLHFFENKKYKEADYVGVVSKKFSAKTQINGKQFLEFIQNNPGYDVYFINPFPEMAYLFFNVWENGEFCHKGIKEAAQKLFDFAKIPLHVDSLGRNDWSTLLYCNFWVGNTHFWESFIPFIKKLFDVVTREMSPEQKQIYFADTAHYDKFPMFPFIFERLFSTYLLMSPDVRYLAYPYSRRELCLRNQHDPYMAKMIDAMGDFIDSWKLDTLEDSKKLAAFLNALQKLMKSFWMK